MKTYPVVITFKDADGRIWTAGGQLMSSMVSGTDRADLMDLKAKGQVTIQDFQVVEEYVVD